jgi:urease accessory protein
MKPQGDNQLALLRLLQLSSPSLPIGAFTYSAGLEWAVEAGWVTDEDSLTDWLIGLLQDNVAFLDLPLLSRCYDAVVEDDWDSLLGWVVMLLAGRETSELRSEERHRGRALASLLVELKIPGAESRRELFSMSQIGPYALACVYWNIGSRDALLSYAWSWLESQAAAAIKLVPLGQSAGQRVQLAVSAWIPAVVTRAMTLSDEDIGGSAPLQAIASSRHETQYTRLFRS